MPDTLAPLTLAAAARAMLDAYGGDVPDWLRPDWEALATVTAAAEARAARQPDALEPDGTRLHLVRWSIDISAATPEEAARLALARMSRPIDVRDDCAPCVFDVAPHAATGGALDTFTTVDLHDADALSPAPRHGTPTAYLDRFPDEHRDTADGAYQDGFSDGASDVAGVTPDVLATLAAAAAKYAGDLESGLADGTYDDDADLDDVREALEAYEGGKPPAREIIITLEGGNVTGVSCASPTPDLRFTTVDYDTDGAERDHNLTRMVKQRDGLWSVAYVCAGQELDHEPALERALATEERFDSEWNDDTAPVDDPRAYSRSKLAGYTVEPDVPGLGFIPRDPEGEEVGEGHYVGERAAWEACDRHRMFGKA